MIKSNQTRHLALFFLIISIQSGRLAVTPSLPSRPPRRPACPTGWGATRPTQPRGTGAGLSLRKITSTPSVLTRSPTGWCTLMAKLRTTPPSSLNALLVLEYLYLLDSFSWQLKNIRSKFLNFPFFKLKSTFLILDLTSHTLT